MLRSAFLAAAALALACGSAMAADRGCKDQLDEIDGILAEHPELLPGVEQWRDDAQRLCREGKEQEAEPVLRDIRAQLDKDLAGNPETTQPATRFR